MIAPAGKFETIISEPGGFFTEYFKRQIGPLAGK
jgi:hypothetical protein